MENIGPVELVYSVVDSVLDAVQGVAHLQRVSEFVDSVSWQEPFIRGIIGVQFLLFMVTYATRRNDIFQFSILFFLTATSLLAERLNEYGRKHWKNFASQNYFDRNGFFMLAFVSGPFIILANFIVIGMFLRLVKLYARRKRREALMRRQSTSNRQRRAASPSEASAVADRKKSK